MTEAERREALEAIATEVRACTRCRLHQQRTRAVPGEGSPETEVVFVGEGPGFNEDQQGRPFVGRAGDLLEQLLGKIGWRREDVFITNVVKCRPPGNRDPEPDEIAACAPYLHRQLELLDPAVVVSLGRYSLGTFMPGAKISTAHGTTRTAPPESGARSATAFALYHPAAALRQGAIEEMLTIDMTELPRVLLEARAARDAAGHPGRHQGADVGDAGAGDSAMPQAATGNEVAPGTFAAAAAEAAQEPAPPAMTALPADRRYETRAEQARETTGRSEKTIEQARASAERSEEPTEQGRATAARSEGAIERRGEAAGQRGEPVAPEGDEAESPATLLPYDLSLAPPQVEADPGQMTLF